MNYLLRFEYFTALYFFLPLLVMSIVVRLYWHKIVTYHYPLASSQVLKNAASHHPYKKILCMIRFVALLILALLIAKPQIVDSSSTIKVKGIDIILAIDVSGSMEIQDDQNDARTRFEIAKDEAIHFINKRTNDAIGLVLFGQDAVSRTPLTLDKLMLRSTVKELAIGVVDPSQTMLFTALVTAANRLKHSKAHSKIIILLTDGEPSEGDLSPHVAIQAAQKLGIKVYTIGIGSDKETPIMHPLYGLVRAPKVNADLLTAIAQQTGGKFFMARNAKDMRAIYDTIDTLETTENQAPLFSNYWDIFIPFVWVVLVLLLIELLLSTFMWFSI